MNSDEKINNLLKQMSFLLRDFDKHEALIFTEYLAVNLLRSHSKPSDYNKNVDIMADNLKNYLCDSSQPYERN